MALNLSAKAISLKIRDADGTWQDYSDQVADWVMRLAKLPPGQSGGVMPATMTIRLLPKRQHGKGLPIDNYADRSLFRWKTETEIMLQSDTGAMDYVPSKQWIVSATPDRNNGPASSTTIETACQIALKDFDSPFDSRLLDFIIGSRFAIQFLIGKLYNIYEFVPEHRHFSGTSLNVPRDWGGNLVTAIDKLLRAAKQVSWCGPRLSTVVPDWATVINQNINTRPDAADVVRTVDVRRCGLAYFRPYREPITPGNTNIPADEYIASCSDVYLYQETPTRTVFSEGNTTTIETLNPGDTESETKITEQQLGSTIYADLPGNYPSGNVDAVVRYHKKRWNRNGDKALIRLEERTDLRGAIAAQALKGALAGEYQRAIDAGEDAGKIAAVIARYSWAGLVEGARGRIEVPSYNSNGAVTKNVITERMTRAEAIAGLGNGVVWWVAEPTTNFTGAVNAPINWLGTVDSKITTTVRHPAGLGRWIEQVTVRVLKCLAGEAERADLNYRLQQAFQGNASDDDPPEPNQTRYHQILTEAFGYVTIQEPPRILDNGANKPPSNDTAPERWTATRTQVEATVRYNTSGGFGLTKAIDVPYCGDLNANGFNEESNAKRFLRGVAYVVGETDRARQTLWDVKGPIWPELLGDGYSPWMAIDVIDYTGIKYRCGLDGLTMVGNQTESFWTSKLVTFGIVDADGNLQTDYDEAGI